MTQASFGGVWNHCVTGHLLPACDPGLGSALVPMAMGLDEKQMKLEAPGDGHCGDPKLLLLVSVLCLEAGMRRSK
jgi:hypothetical protein